MAPQNKLLAAIGSLAITWYFFCICYIGLIAPPSPADPNAVTKIATSQNANQPITLPQFMSMSITTLGATLATFVGMVLGFQQTKSAAPAAAGNPAPVTQLSIFQIIAAWAYVASLILALVIWWSHSNCDASIMHLGQSFIGLIGGALAVMLNV